MEISAKQETPAFKAVEVTIKLTTQEEFDAFKKIFANHSGSTLCHTNLSSVNAFDDPKCLSFATAFLHALWNQIKNY